MKLIFAGISSNFALDYSNFVFNCTRNRNCQRPYYVPIRSLQDLVLYMDLPAKPDMYEATLFDMCNLDCTTTGGDFSDDFSDDFDTGGEVCDFSTSSLVFDKYVVAQTPSNSWYGVFGNPNNLIPNLKTFFIRFVFTIAGQDYVYYSEQFELEECDPLLLLKACYPNETTGADATDCNGLYYGFPVGNDFLGTKNYRYFHWAYVRNGSVFDYKQKLSLSFFNSKKTYKTVSTKQQLLEFELVPEFYKRVIMGILERGNIRIADFEYRLDEEQNWQVADYDSKLWQLDTVLTDECKLYFGCGASDCLLPSEESVCENPPDDFSFEFVDEACCNPVVTSATTEYICSKPLTSFVFQQTFSHNNPDSSPISTINFTGSEDEACSALNSFFDSVNTYGSEFTLAGSAYFVNSITVGENVWAYVGCELVGDVGYCIVLGIGGTNELGAKIVRVVGGIIVSIVDCTCHFRTRLLAANQGAFSSSNSQMNLFVQLYFNKKTLGGFDDIAWINTIIPGCQIVITLITDPTKTTTVTITSLLLDDPDFRAWNCTNAGPSTYTMLGNDRFKICVIQP